MSKPKVEIYTDGACSGNPGVGAWAAILSAGQAEKEIYGGEKHTTNNRMELTAVIESLKQLKKACQVLLHSDSAYIVNAINQNWLTNWQKNNWKNSAKQEVSNQDLWKELLVLLNTHDVQFIKVKGHANNEKNNRCDALAVAMVKKIKEEEGL